MNLKNICYLALFGYLLSKINQLLEFFMKKCYHSHSRFKKTNLNFPIPENPHQVRYHRKHVPINPDAIIIGSGMGGLTTAALLTLAGKKVVVLEKHTVAGGATHCFQEFGIEFETGLHYLGNLHKRKPIFDLLTRRKLNWCQLGHENPAKFIYDRIYIGDQVYEFPSGEENLILYLGDLFPQEKKGIRQYFQLVKKVAQLDKYILLKCFPFHLPEGLTKLLFPEYYHYCRTSTLEVIKHYITHPELISVLCGQFGDYGKSPSDSSFWIHANIVNHYLQGGWYPEGGSGKIAEYISETIWSGGGAVLVGQGVKEIMVDTNNRAYGIKLDNGHSLKAPQIVSATGFRNTFRNLIRQSQVPEKYQEILHQVPPSVQHIYAFLKLEGSPEELKLPSSNAWIYPHGNFDKLMVDLESDPIEAPLPMFIGFSCAKDYKWSSHYPGFSNAVILAPLSKEVFQDWEDERIMKRGEDYENLKNIYLERMLREGLFKIRPDLDGKVLDQNVATPLTTQYYLNSTEGESYGLDTNLYRLTEGNHLRIPTEIKNLYLTGQDVCTMGVTGAMMGGILTCQVLLGYDNLGDILLGNNIVKDLIKKYE